MRSYKLTKASTLTFEEKKKLIDMYELDDLFDTLRDYDNYSDEFDKEVIIAVHNKLFELGITCI